MNVNGIILHVYSKLVLLRLHLQQKQNVIIISRDAPLKYLEDVNLKDFATKQVSRQHVQHLMLEIFVYGMLDHAVIKFVKISWHHMMKYVINLSKDV